MYKSLGFMARRDDLTAEQFARRWVVGHRPLATRAHSFARYVANIIVERSGQTGPFDGIGEQWFEAREALDRYYAHPDSRARIAADVSGPPTGFLKEVDKGGFAVIPEVIKGPPELERGGTPGTDRDAVTIPSSGRKVFATLGRAAGEDEEFIERARAAARTLAGSFPGLTALTLNVLPPRRRVDVGYDVVLEGHFDQSAPLDLLAALRPAVEGALAGHLGQSGWYLVREYVQFGPGDPRPARDHDTASKMFALLRRRPGLGDEELFERWVVGHKRVALRHHGMARYTVSLFTPRPGTEPGWDGLAELWFDSVEAARARFYLYGEESRRAVDEDIRGFIGGIASVSMVPRAVKGAPELDRGPGEVDETGLTRPGREAKLVGLIGRGPDETPESFAERGEAAARALGDAMPGLTAITWNVVPTGKGWLWTSPAGLPAATPSCDGVLEAWLADSAPPDLPEQVAASFRDRLGGRAGPAAWYLAREYVQYG